MFYFYSRAYHIYPTLTPFRQDIVRLYADAEATMGEARLVGETGPDVAGKNLSPTTVKVGYCRIPFLSLCLCHYLLINIFFDGLLFSSTGIHHETHVQSIEVLLRSQDCYTEGNARGL
jgi:hypothetical protein